MGGTGEELEGGDKEEARVFLRLPLHLGRLL